MSNIGARFIWNTRFFHIANANERLSNYAISGERAKDLVEYVGTRETVALNISEKFINEPATEKQIKLIEELTRMAPNCKNTLEYEDYKQAPTTKNASELISVLSEEVMMQGEFDEAANLIEYAAKRPGVIKVGNHGLFSYEDDINLQQAQKEISSHKGNIWTHVLSLRREDADKLGYDSQASWKALVKSNVTTLAEEHNIKLSNLRWYAAMHDTGTHPHIHLFVFSKNPNEGFFSNKGKHNSLENCKRAFASKIFAADLENEYVSKHEYREKLKNETNEIIKQLEEAPLEYYSDGDKNELINKMKVLSNSIPHDKEVKYGYLSADLKNLVNEIQKDIVYKNEKLSALYLKWCEHQFNIERVYITHPEQVPIDENKEFTPIKNAIIKHAQGIALTSEAAMFNSTVEEQNTSNVEETDKLYPNDNRSAEEIFDELTFYSDTKHRDGDICCQLADCYFYGKGTTKDVGQAMMWYSIAADQYQNGVAGYRLGDIYSVGAKDIEVDTQLADYYYKNAFYCLKNSSINRDTLDAINEDKEIKYFHESVSAFEAYKEHLVGCMYFEGKGVEKNYDKAFSAFLLAAGNGNTKAKLLLSKMLLHGIGIECDTQAGLDILTELAVEKKDASAAYELYSYCKDKSEFTITQKMMYLGISAQNGNTFAQCKLAAYYYTKGDVDSAVELYKKAAEKNSPEALYQLGAIYRNPANSNYYDTDASTNYFNKSLNLYNKNYLSNPNGYTAYRIAQHYHYGLGVQYNAQEAYKWYDRASEHTNKELTQEKESVLSQDASVAPALTSTVLHIARVFQNSTTNSANNRTSLTDKKLLKEIKQKKQQSGQAPSDKSYGYD